MKSMGSVAQTTYEGKLTITRKTSILAEVNTNCVARRRCGILSIDLWLEAGGLPVVHAE
jgi:hypothetical protein